MNKFEQKMKFLPPSKELVSSDEIQPDGRSIVTLLTLFLFCYNVWFR